MRRFALSLLLGTAILLGRPAAGRQQAPDQQKAPEQPSTFSDAAANDVLNALRDGLEAHSPRLMLSAFDHEKMNAYSVFEDQVQAFFSRYESFRVRYRIIETSADNTRGVALVDFEMEEMPVGGNAPAQRKIAQIRFEFERARKGWKIVDVQPRAFFS